MFACCGHGRSLARAATAKPAILLSAVVTLCVVLACFRRGVRVPVSDGQDIGISSRASVHAWFQEFEEKHLSFIRCCYEGVLGNSRLAILHYLALRSTRSPRLPVTEI